jgi:catechol 2,3-dioxygenase-like lactoylglutathione lyase family enzyme
MGFRHWLFTIDADGTSKLTSPFYYAHWKGPGLTAEIPPRIENMSGIWAAASPRALDLWVAAPKTDTVTLEPVQGTRTYKVTSVVCDVRGAVVTKPGEQVFAEWWSFRSSELTVAHFAQSAGAANRALADTIEDAVPVHVAVTAPNGARVEITNGTEFLRTVKLVNIEAFSNDRLSQLCRQWNEGRDGVLKIVPAADLELHDGLAERVDKPARYLERHFGKELSIVEGHELLAGLPEIFMRNLFDDEREWVQLQTNRLLFCTDPALGPPLRQKFALTAWRILAVADPMTCEWTAEWLARILAWSPRLWHELNIHIPELLESGHVTRSLLLPLLSKQSEADPVLRHQLVRMSGCLFDSPDPIVRKWIESKLSRWLREDSSVLKPASAVLPVLATTAPASTLDLLCARLEAHAATNYDLRKNVVEALPELFAVGSPTLTNRLLDAVGAWGEKYHDVRHMVTNNLLASVMVADRDVRFRLLKIVSDWCRQHPEVRRNLPKPVAEIAEFDPNEAASWRRIAAQPTITTGSALT